MIDSVLALVLAAVCGAGAFVLLCVLYAILAARVGALEEQQEAIRRYLTRRSN